MRFTDAEILAAINDPHFVNGQKGRPTYLGVAGRKLSVHASLPFVTVVPSKKAVLEIRSVQYSSNTLQNIHLRLTTLSQVLGLVAQFAGVFDVPDDPVVQIQNTNPTALARSYMKSGGNTTGEFPVSACTPFYYTQSDNNSPPAPIYFSPSIVLFGDGGDTSVFHSTGVTGGAGDLEIGFVGREWPYDLNDY